MRTERPHLRGGASGLALRVSVTYGLVAACWILFSDRVVAALSTEARQLTLLQNYKGWAFVAVTALLLYIVLRGAVRKWEREQERKERAEEKLRKLSHAVEQSPVSVVITDTTGTIEYVNPRFTEVSGYSFEEAVGRNPRILKSGRQPPEVYRQLWAQIAAGGTWSGELQNRRKNGQLFWERAVMSPILDATGRITHFLAVKEDITERRALEEQFLQAQKMEAVGQLSGGIAHDFNNLLIAMAGHVSLAREQLAPGHAVQSSLSGIETAIVRARGVVRRILTFSRQQPFERRAIKLAPVVDEVVNLLQVSVPATIHIRTHLAPDVPDVEADATQVHQILMNLGTNALHAMEKENQGTLDIRLESVLEDGQPKEDRRDLRSGRYARLSVGDTGCGMDEATLERIFEPFFTTKPPGVGTGLGLSVVRGIMKGHNGAVTVRSRPGEGTVFHLYFPAAKTPAGDTETRVAEVPRGNERILYVDDEAALVELSRQILGRLGYQVTGYTTAERALEVFRSNPNDFDAMVSDCAMPRMTGFDLAEQILRIRPGFPVILASGYITPKDTERAKQLGIEQLILKPNTVEDLGRTLHEVLRARRNPGEPTVP